MSEHPRTPTPTARRGAVSDEPGDLVLEIGPGYGASTRVLVDDGGMIVLGGLIEDRLTESESRVPLLGKIPVEELRERLGTAIEARLVEAGA